MFECMKPSTRSLWRIPGLRRFRRERRSGSEMAANSGGSTDMAGLSALEVHAPTDEGTDTAESSSVAMHAPTDESTGTARVSALEMDEPKDEVADAARFMNEGKGVGAEPNVEADRSPTATIKPPTQPIPNFPLPRELRDEIYAYLLDVERVEETATTAPSTVPDHYDMCFKVARYEGPRKTYNFTTGIMAVNKSMGAEARAYFVNHNRFVQVHFDVETFQRLQIMTDLPIIANLKEQHMDQQCLTIEVGWPKTPSIADFALSKYAANFQNKGSVIIALRSLPKLCEIFRFICAIEVPVVPVVASTRGEKFSVFAGGTTLDSKPGTFQIKVAVHKPTSTANALPVTVQHFILKQLGTIRAGGFNCSINGFDDQAMVDETKTAMSPLLIFPGAFAVDFVDAFRQMKRHADALATAGHLSPAHYRYAALGRWFSDCWGFVKEEFDASLTHYGRQALLSQSALPLKCLRLDLALSSFAMAIHFRISEGMTERIELLRAEMDDMPQRMCSWFVHLSTFGGLRAFQLKEFPTMVERDFLIAISYTLDMVPMKDAWIDYDLQAIRSCIAVMLELGAEGTEQISSSGDSDLVKMYKDSEAGRAMSGCRGSSGGISRVRDLVPQLSLWTMPFRVYDSTDDPGIPPQAAPGDFEGWEDCAHLAELTKEDERAVHGWQQSMGLTLSTFG